MTISNATLFKQAHAMTRETIQAGDCYRTTFGACLKAVKDDTLKVTSINLFTVLSAIIMLIAAKFSTVNGDIIYRNNASLITTYHTSKLLGAFKWCVILSPIIIAMLALLAATTEAETVELPTNKGAIVYDHSQTVTADSSLDTMFNDIQVAIDDSGVEGITIIYSE